ncbi:beta-N-acetylhexosaminidase [Allosphingosinicella sp.]|jgi:beta-N-acetylhexosaminidase|uniref:beta-N-acetylhexosaminidase n=1 Tax=Allosphingosinicella sp. TaxID=2823234 RepID=UPI002EF52F06
MLPAIFSLSGPELTPDERALFRSADPAGYILFRRNAASPAQLRALTDELRALAGRDDLPILIDQEGGRVARLRPPEWPAFPSGEKFDSLYRVAPISAIEAARVNAQAIALTLREAGINVDCLPLLDVRQPGTHDAIGDRALGSEPMQVAALGRAILEGLRSGGVVGVVKHMPGQGRAISDSHVELPVVSAARDELESDFEPFRSLAWAPMGMTAHLLFTAIDPERCATLSPVIIEQVIRRHIGFDGLLLSDDLAMEALSGSVAERAHGALAAGCDIALHCSGRLGEMEELAESLGGIGEQARARLERAMATIAGGPDPAGLDDLLARRDALLAYA